MQMRISSLGLINEAENGFRVDEITVAYLVNLRKCRNTQEGENKNMAIRPKAVKVFFLPYLLPRYSELSPPSSAFESKIRLPKMILLSVHLMTE